MTVASVDQNDQSLIVQREKKNAKATRPCQLTGSCTGHSGKCSKSFTRGEAWSRGQVSALGLNDATS